MRKRKACYSCDGTGFWKGLHRTGTCYACNGKGWRTPQQIINHVQAMKRKREKVHPAPVQYKD